jgi:hypothetical protein
MVVVNALHTYRGGDESKFEETTEWQNTTKATSFNGGLR